MKVTFRQLLAFIFWPVITLARIWVLLFGGKKQETTLVVEIAIPDLHIDISGVILVIPSYSQPTLPLRRYQKALQNPIEGEISIGKD